MNIVTKFYDRQLFPPFKLLSIVDYPPDCSGSFHSHDFFQLALCLSGKIKFTNSASKSIEVHSGEIAIMPPGFLHVWSIPQGSPCKAIQIFNLPMLLENYGDLSIILGRNVSEWRKIDIGSEYAKNIGPRLESEFGADTPGGNVMVQACLLEILTFALRNAWDSAPKAESREKKAISKALSYIEKHYRGKISLEELAANSYLGTSRFSQVFKENTGYSPVQYVNVFRLEKAKILLAYSEMSITEIANYLGFETIHYFSRAFKKHSGMPPVEFMALHKKS